MKLLMIGCGKMGSALLTAWLQRGGIDATIVDPGLQNAPPGTQSLVSHEDLGNQKFDLIVIAVKPQMTGTVLPAYQGQLADGGVFVSIVAGTARQTLMGLVKAPVIRIMPNLPALIGKGVTAICRLGATEAQVIVLEKLLAANGSTVLVDTEDDIDRFTAVAGSGPAYMFEVLRTYTDAAIGAGFDPEVARRLTVETMLGAAALARDSSDDFATLRNNVTSKAGTTEAGLNELRAGDDLAGRFDRTINAAFARAKELSHE